MLVFGSLQKKPTDLRRKRALLCWMKSRRGAWLSPNSSPKKKERKYKRLRTAKEEQVAWQEL